VGWIICVGRREHDGDWVKGWRNFVKGVENWDKCNGNWVKGKGIRDKDVVD
jgi:hypothetical protein